MARNKTTETTADVFDFINRVENAQRRKDSLELIEIYRNITGSEPKMWGPSIIGFGTYHYKYKSGHEGDAPLAGFAPRKDSLVLYMATKFEDREQLLSKLGKHKSSKSCIYAKKLQELDLPTLRLIIRKSMQEVQKLYPS